MQCYCLIVNHRNHSIENLDILRNNAIAFMSFFIIEIIPMPISIYNFIWKKLNDAT